VRTARGTSDVVTIKSEASHLLEMDSLLEYMAVVSPELPHVKCCVLTCALTWYLAQSTVNYCCCQALIIVGSEIGCSVK